MDRSPPLGDGFLGGPGPMNREPQEVVDEMDHIAHGFFDGGLVQPGFYSLVKTPMADCFCRYKKIEHFIDWDEKHLNIRMLVFLYFTFSPGYTDWLSRIAVLRWAMLEC
jgi:hypothetical protein